MIPTNSQFLYPCLSILNDYSPIKREDMMDKLARHFKLAKTDLSEPTRSGSKTKYESRIDWVRQHLRWAGFMVIPKRGTWMITDEGKAYLTSHTDITIKDLMKIPSFAAHKR